MDCTIIMKAQLAGICHSVMSHIKCQKCPNISPSAQLQNPAGNVVSVSNIGMGWIQPQSPNIFPNQHFT